MTFMSSGHNPDHTKSIRRKKGDGSSIDVECPVSIVDYNQYMGGVDRGDQYMQYYRCHIKSHKSYKHLFWYVFDVCVLNAFILSRYSPTIHPISSYLSFRKQLANELIGNYNCHRCHLVVNAQHFPCKAPSRCTCKFPNCKSQTVWYCSTCDKHLCHTGDHTTDCFLKHHAQHHLYSS